jgi:hypothetical protein
MMTKSRYTLLLAAAAVLGVAGCDIDPDIAAPYTPPGTGTVSGQVFYDANDNRQFDPIAGDTLITGARIEIAERGDSTRVVASGNAGAEGRFTIANVPVGSYELRAIVSGNQTLTCAPAATSVYVGETSFASTATRISCRIDIKVAKTRALGSLVTVAGIVTAAPGVYRPTNLYVQDTSGGIQGFNVPGGAASGIALGDSIEITGPMGQFGQELEVTPVSSFRIVKKDARLIEPRERTVQQLLDELANAGTANQARTIGELIVVKGVRITNLPATNSTGSGTDFRIVQGAAQVPGRLDQNANGNIPVSTLAGDRCFDITGVLGYFSPNLQLKPRDVNDIKVVTCPAN